MRYALILVVCLSSQVHGQQFEPVTVDEGPEKMLVISDASEISVTLSINYLNKYVLDGVVYSDDPVVQTDLFISLPHGFYADLWWSVGTNDDDFSSDFADEIDYIIGWEGDIYQGLTLNLAAMYFDLVDLGKFSEDILQLYAGLSYEIKIDDHHMFTPFVTFEYAIPINWEGVEGGVQVNVGLKHSWTLAPNWTLGQQFQVIYDSGVAGLDAGFVGEYGTTLSWQINKSIMLNLIQLRVSTPLSSMDDSRETEFIYGIGVSIGF